MTLVELTDVLFFFFFFTVIIKLLLQHDARVGDGLLRAVDTQFLDAVKLICKHAETLGVSSILALYLSIDNKTQVYRKFSSENLGGCNNPSLLVRCVTKILRLDMV